MPRLLTRVSARRGTADRQAQIARSNAEYATAMQWAWDHAAHNAGIADHLDELKTKTLTAIEQFIIERQVHAIAFAWSGGKDSRVLEHLLAQLGITRGMIGLTDGLEYPAIEEWLRQHKPPTIEEVRRPFTLHFLVEHPEMLFPRSSDLQSRWYKHVWQLGQDIYCARNGIDLLILGRRASDGNYTGPSGQDFYERGGVIRYSPLRNWTQEDILAYLALHAIALPPFYQWPNGFWEGTHAWPMRSEVLSVEDGWSQVFSIDPSIVEQAAYLLPSAQDFLRKRGG